MKSLFYVNFLVSLAKSGILIAIGMLLINYFETLMAFIVRKPIPDELIDKHKYRAFMNIVKLIGIFIIVIGVGVAVFAVVTLKTGLNPPINNINFKSLEDMLNQIR